MCDHGTHKSITKFAHCLHTRAQVCFLTFGAHMLYLPYVEAGDDRLAQLSQVQIFFALLSSILLKYDDATLANSSNVDTLLSVVTFLPFALGLYLECEETVGWAREKAAPYIQKAKEKSAPYIQAAKEKEQVMREKSARAVASIRKATTKGGRSAVCTSTYSSTGSAASTTATVSHEDTSRHSTGGIALRHSGASI